MEALECILTRRSIRKFTKEQVTKEEIQKIVALASYAPSWKNVQTTGYVAVLNEELKNKIADECVEDFKWNEKIIHNASALIAVTTVNGRSGFERDGAFSTLKGTHWQSFDAGAAAQTFCLAAHDLSLGTVILGIYNEEKLAKIINLDEGKSISALIAIGCPEEEPTAPKRKQVSELLSIIE